MRLSLIFATFWVFLTACTSDKPKPYQATNNDEYLEQIEAQSGQEIKADAFQVYTYVGVALFVAGVAMVAFTPKIKSGAVIAAGGVVAMSSPFIFNSPWFDWVFGTAIAVIVLDGLYFLIRYSITYYRNRNG